MEQTLRDYLFACKWEELRDLQQTLLCRVEGTASSSKNLREAILRHATHYGLTMAQALVKYMQVHHSQRDGQTRRLIPAIYADNPPKCATIAHFGRYDQGIPMEGVEALIAKAHPTAQIFIYDANHGFNSDRRKDYHEPSADLARERTLALFKACGG